LSASQPPGGVRPLPENTIDLASARCDLHLHSSFSDGTLSPAEIVDLARARGVNALSLTDHDTVAGLEEARSACRDAAILFIPGVELSVGYGNGEIHLLAYGMDIRSKSLRETLDRLAAERVRRMERMVELLQGMGVKAEFDGIKALAGGNILSRLHLATYLAREGFAASRDDAFARYIGNGKPAFVRRRILTLPSALELVVGTGGVAVLAHPALTRRDDLIEYLVRIGIRGLEAYYPKHSPGDTARYLKLCRRYDLLATGGSDYHGAGKPESPLGATLTPPDQLERLLKSIRL
jgi:predicted metal-dependent phosphoesterase TrpH